MRKCSGLSSRMRLVLAVVATCGALPVQAGEDLLSALAESTVAGYFKAMYIADDKKGGRLDQSTAGFGGKLGGETGTFYGFSLKAAWYTTGDLGTRRDDARRTDAYMFDVDKKPYSLIGEAQIRFAAGRTRLVAGRQEFFSPLINTYDYRIIPNLFEAVTLTNRDLPDTTLTLAYVSRMSGLDGVVSFAEFRSMSQQAYTSLRVAANGAIDGPHGTTLDPSSVVGNKGVWVTGLVYDKAFRVQAWNYYGVDTLNSLYLDGRVKQDLGHDISLVAEAQTYHVAEVGLFKDYLARQGLNASYSLYGLKGTLAHQKSGLSVALAGNRFTGQRNTVSAYGNWGGYPEFVLMPYVNAENNGVSAIAGSRTAKLTVLWDLRSIGLAEQSLLFGHARIDIDEAIQPASDIVVNSLIYRARLSPKVSARLAAEARSSANSRYDNKFVALALRYDF